ncbi:MAG: hypothetical protein K5905_20280 [Roseibium sp.]|uniref:hypothetical protein n=1 Tax=Roseibium sp. TaxID=1936156 RepID=UPI0026371581|nr:hypothetical protein [Roseibium sp.]MCV0427801.1 hypothetical protein [Roseibium sp.]
MNLGQRKFSKTVTNGAQEEFVLETASDDPTHLHWWAETCLMFYALSEGDRSSLRGSINLLAEDKTPVFMTGLTSVTNELYTRLSFLGFTEEDPDGVPEELTEILKAHTLTEYGRKHLPDFYGAQTAQMEHLGGDIDPIRKFTVKFSPLWDHHGTFPVETLMMLRHFFSDPKHALENDFTADSARLFELYSQLDVVEFFENDTLVTPTFLGTVNIPFLLDILIHQKGGTRSH